MTESTMERMMMENSRTKVPTGRVVKKALKKVVPRKRKFITHMLESDLGQRFLKPAKRFPFLGSWRTPTRVSRCSHSPTRGNGQTVHQKRDSPGTRIIISTTHHRIQMIMMPKL